MSTRKPHAGPFHRKLSLSLDEKMELSRTAKRLVRDVVESYERFLWTDHEQLSPARWAAIRAREDIRVYHDRRLGAGTEDRDLNMLLAVGTVVGSLHDAMYGVLNHTTESMRLKTAYVQDAVRDAAVLATIQEPKPDKPFRSLTVKWLLKPVPFAARAMTKHRDVVYMEATGTKRLSNGELVGFHLLHAVKYAQTPVLPQYMRLGLSSCGLWRQQTSERVQLYMKSYFEVPERLLAPLIVRSAADALVSMWRTIHCAQMKKLAWLLRCKTRQLEDQSLAKRTIHPYRELCCAVCNTQASTARQGAKSTCVICARRVCTSCRVQRELFSIQPDDQLLMRRVSFCVPCLTIAVRADAADVARDEIPGAQLPQGTLAELVRVVGTRSSCPVVTETERRRDLERRRRSMSTLGGAVEWKESLSTPLHSTASVQLH